MGILLLLALIWFAGRASSALRDTAVDAVGPGSADRSTPGPVEDPQDAVVDPWGPDADVQDVVDVPPGRQIARREAAAATADVEDEWSALTGVRRALLTALRDAAGWALLSPETTPASAPADPPRDPLRSWQDALHAAIEESVDRPTASPASLGGRDTSGYLRGWDDAVGWIALGHDAEPPTWGNVAYMTGWKDGIRAVDRARRRSTGWPGFGGAAAA